MGVVIKPHFLRAFFIEADTMDIGYFGDWQSKSSSRNDDTEPNMIINHTTEKINRKCEFYCADYILTELLSTPQSVQAEFLR